MQCLQPKPPDPKSGFRRSLCETRLCKTSLFPNNIYRPNQQGNVCYGLISFGDPENSPGQSPYDIAKSALPASIGPRSQRLSALAGTLRAASSRLRYRLQYHLQRWGLSHSPLAKFVSTGRPPSFFCTGSHPLLDCGQAHTQPNPYSLIQCSPSGGNFLFEMVSPKDILLGNARQHEYTICEFVQVKRTRRHQSLCHLLAMAKPILTLSQSMSKQCRQCKVQRRRWKIQKEQ